MLYLIDVLHVGFMCWNGRRSSRHVRLWFLAKKSEFYAHKQKCIHTLFNFSLRHFSLSVLSKTVNEMKFLWKKALPFSPKSSQNGKNSMADNLTMTDHNGKVRIYSGSSWLKFSCHIGLYMVSTESWNQLIMEFLNPLYVHNRWK
jgi:hypothetical protein